MDSSRYWNTIRNVADWERTRDLWDVARMEVTDYAPNEFQYARGNATRAYSPEKLELFTRDLLYLPRINALVICDHVRSKDPSYKKVWLLHGVNEPSVTATDKGRDIGQGGTSYAAASAITFEEGAGRLLLHTLMPRDREVVKRGGQGWEFWTPGDEFGGPWGSGKNWPIEGAEGGPLPDDPYLRKMWKTFWGEDFNRILPSNMRHVVPGAWRIEISPAKPSTDDLFLNVLEIGDQGETKSMRVELADGSNLIGALIAGQTLAVFPTGATPVASGEITLPDLESETLIVTGLKPESTYQLELTGGKTTTWGGGLFQGVHLWSTTAETDRSGVLKIPFSGHKDARLRLHLLHE
jgi:heparin/heparan-sulfate lyase